MLKWLVQKMPDPLKNGIGIEDNDNIKIENLTDDPLATLDLRRCADDEVGLRKKFHRLRMGINSDDPAWKEIYSVNR